MLFPRLVKVRRRFPCPRTENVEEALWKQCSEEEISSRIQPGTEVAITAGSRGISNIDRILRVLVEFLRERGASPFIVPAMGSHGGATARGQVAVLKDLGITEQSVGAPVRSSMEVVKLCKMKSGSAVYMDRIAAEADGVVVCSRIKPHTSFSSDVESGLCKMASIGLGKHEQALRLHARGVEGIRDQMVEAAEKVFDSGKVLFGVGIVENAYEETATVEAIPAENVVKREKELLREAKKLMPKLPVSEIDVLFVDEIGKNYSGTGMDTNVIGRLRIPGVEEPTSPSVKYIIAGDLGEKSHGNALGIGLADLTTRRLFEKIDRDATNKNVLTSTFLERAKIPMVLENDREALEAAVRCNWDVVPEETRFVRIPNTLELRHAYISENLVEEALENGNAEVVEKASEIRFDGDGNLPGFEEDADRTLGAPSGA